MKHEPIGAAEAMIICSAIKKEVDSTSTWPYKEKKVECAGKAAQCTIEFWNKKPIGCSFEDSKTAKTKLYAAAQENARVGILPLIGFSTILWWIMSGIVSWVVKRILDAKFNKETT